MRRPLLLALALLLPLAAAQGLLPEAPPVGAETTSGGVTLAHWVGNATTADVRVASGGEGEAWFALANATKRPLAENGTTVAYVNLTSAGASFLRPNLTLTMNRTSGVAWAFADSPFLLAANATETVEYAWTLQAYDVAEDGNATLLADTTGMGFIGVEVPAPPPPAPFPTTYLYGGAAVVLVAVGAGALALRSRSQRRKMRGQTRSQALREVELEERAVKKPEEAAVIRQEIRQQEKVKEKRRDLQILEAKRADVLKTMDLLRKRHETGGLSRLQYDNMVAKKQQDLARIEADIAAMEAEDQGPGAAA